MFVTSNKSVTLYFKPHNYLTLLNHNVALGDLVVSVFSIEPKVRGFRPGQKRWLFMGDKIRSNTFFGEEVKLSVPCCKILLHVKNPYNCERDNDS
jgi:hypothetical protein